MAENELMTDLEMRELMAQVQKLLNPGARESVIGSGPLGGELVTAVRVMAQILDALLEKKVGNG